MSLRHVGQRSVFPIALAPVPPAVPQPVQPRDEMYATVVAGVEAGCTMLDAGWLLPGEGALSVIAEAVGTGSGSGRLVVAGHLRVPPAAVDDRSLDASLTAAAETLGRPLDVVLLHPPEGGALPTYVPGAASSAVVSFGLAEVDLPSLRRWVGDPIVAVQPLDLSDDELLAACLAQRLAYLPRLPGTNRFRQPAAPFESVTAIAQDRSASAGQLALAWLLRRAEVTVPVVECAHEAEIEAAVHAVDIDLDEAEFARLGAALPASLAIFGPDGPAG